jgi:pantoate--beta-alanine ligase
MQLLKSVAAMQAWSERQRLVGIPIALVPTRGCLHAGPLSLVHVARRRLGARGAVVLSIYVNPTQFGPGEDFKRYPRDLKQDLGLCRQAGVDVVFAPSDAQMYPERCSTVVVEESVSLGMEGGSRPGHFRGVTTVVAKLFHAVRPHVAVFGAKDFQQATVIRRMTRDLLFGVTLVVAPTVREADGLALSSRNRYLKGAMRSQATVLWRALRTARALVREADPKRGVPASALKRRLAALIEEAPDARLDYIEFFETATLAPLGRVRRGARMALAVFLGETRLIDNGSL